MKIYPQLKLKSIFFLGALIGLTTIFQSCKIDHNDEPQPDISALTIVNASPNSAGLNFFIENQLVNPANFNFPLRIPYQRVYAGTRVAKVTAVGNTATLFSGNIVLEANSYHSLFIVGKVPTLDFLLIKDDLSFPTSGKSKLRFANLSPDAPALSLEIVGDTTQFANKAFKTFTGFKNVNPGTVTLNLRNTTTNAIVATMPNVQMLADKVYTIWAKGLVTTTVDAEKLGLHVINHDN
jgi:hypothetical protein